MLAPDLITTDESIRLIEPNIERDAPLSVDWLEGEQGRETLAAMGVPEKDIHEPTLEGEEERIRELIESTHHVAWMIEFDGDVVGVVEIELEPTDYIDAPAISVMIGDPWARGRGIATASLRSAIDWLHAEYENIFVYARYRVSNEASAQMLLKVGFEEDGTTYTDSDGLVWQNVILRDEN